MWKTGVVQHVKPLLRRKGRKLPHLLGLSTRGSVTFQTLQYSCPDFYLWDRDYSDARALSRILYLFPWFMLHRQVQMSHNTDHHLCTAPICSLVEECIQCIHIFIPVIPLKMKTIYTGKWKKSHSFLLMPARPTSVQVNIILLVPLQTFTSQKQLQLPWTVLPGFMVIIVWLWK